MDNLPITIADIGIVTVLAISGLFAYARGFVHEVLSVGGWVGAIFATIFGLPYIKPHARDLIPYELAADLAGGAAIFIVTLVLLSFVTRAVSKRVKDSALNAIDRSLGFVFGLARGAVVVALAYILVEWMMPPADQPAWLRDARAMPLVEDGADLLRDLASVNGDPAAPDSPTEVLSPRESLPALDDIIAPKPKRQSAGDDAPSNGYGATQRQQLERLIESNQ